jgi:hypothetical protein
MSEIDLIVAVSISIAGLMLAAGGALWIARHDNVKPHTPPGE